jgi:hypothetical protein
MKPRVWVGGLILIAWGAGVGMTFRREYFRPRIERLAEAALRVSPGAVFYAVMQGEKQVGFASSTLDTAATTIEQRDYLVVDLVAGGQVHRATARTNVILTRTLRVRSFEAEVEADSSPMTVKGTVSGDTTLSYVLNPVPGATGDTQHVSIAGPILLPTLVPLAVALENTPKVGRKHVLPVFDPATMAPRNVTFAVEAETVFVVNDSSVLDTVSGKWHGVLPDTVRAWRVAPESGGNASPSWIDAQGRVVSTRQMGFELRRMPYEVAFENWRQESNVAARAARRTATVATSNANRDIFETTAIASNKRISRNVTLLRARLTGVDLKGFDLDGGRQRFAGDTLEITREGIEGLAPRYFPILNVAERAKVLDLRKEPFLEVDHREIRALAERLADGSRDPRVIVERINRWVFDSVKKEVTVGIPSALHVLHTRTGDCNEHTQLFVAIARAAGIPTRVASGLVYLDGKFYYHAWPEVMLRGWVAVDPTFGQFPADAAHLRFVTGGLARQAELLRLVGNLRIQVLTTR